MKKLLLLLTSVLLLFSCEKEEVILEPIFEISLNGESFDPNDRYAKINSFAGGGDTIAAMSLAGVKSDFTYVSTGGGALLELIEGKKLPGLVALNILE